MNLYMKTQLIMPQEFEVFYVLPGIRREMALAMKAAGKKQKDIAKLLCVEESTVSQYVNDGRATKLKLSKKIKDAVAESSRNIHDNVSLIRETRKVLSLLMKENVTCKLHKLIAKLPDDCKVCFKG